MAPPATPSHSDVTTAQPPQTPTIISAIPPPHYDANNDWDCYEDQLDIYYLAKKITTDEEKKLAMLQSIGAKTYINLKAWCLPKKPVEKTYTELIEILRQRFSRKTDPMLARLHLSSTRQGTEESVPDFIRKMAALSGPCEYKEDISLIQEIIKGLSSDDLRFHLLRIENRKSTLTEFVQVVDSYLAYQAVQKAMVSVQHPAKPIPITMHEVKETAKKTLLCDSCGKPHWRNTCQFRHAICKYCQKSGHIASVCRSKPTTSSIPPPRGSIQRHPDHQNKRLHQVAADDQFDPDNYDPDSEGEYLGSFNVLQEDEPVDVRIAPLWIPVRLNGHLVQMQHDSGAALSIIDTKTWRMIGCPTILPQHYMITGCLRQPVELLGKCFVTAAANGRTATMPLLVSKRRVTPLFGRPWIHQFNVPYIPCSISTAKINTPSVGCEKSHLSSRHDNSANTVHKPCYATSVHATSNSHYSIQSRKSRLANSSLHANTSATFNSIPTHRVTRLREKSRKHSCFIPSPDCRKSQASYSYTTSIRSNSNSETTATTSSSMATSIPTSPTDPHVDLKTNSGSTAPYSNSSIVTILPKDDALNCLQEVCNVTSPRDATKRNYTPQRQCPIHVEADTSIVRKYKFQYERNTDTVNADIRYNIPSNFNSHRKRTSNNFNTSKKEGKQ